MSERGKYIVIEGADATGKSEQANRLSDRLRSIGKQTLLVINDDTDKMEPIQEPGGVPTANALRKIIKNGTLERDPWTNVILFTAARRLNWLQAMKPALDRGVWVVSARSWISTVTYQGYGQGVDIESIRRRTLEDVGPEYLSPDVEVILTVADEQARRSLMEERGPLAHPDTFESLPDDFQQNMKDGYVKFAEFKDLPIVPVHVWPSMTDQEKEESKEAVSDVIWQRVKPLAL